MPASSCDGSDSEASEGSSFTCSSCSSNGSTAERGGFGSPDPGSEREPAVLKPISEMCWRERLELLFNDADAYDHLLGVHTAGAVNALTVMVIIASQALLCLESSPEYYEASLAKEQPWFGMEAAIVAFFTLEILSRFVAETYKSSYFKEFFLDPLNIIDLLAVLPFYVELAASSDLSINLSMLRVLRVVRVIKMSRAVKGIVTLAQSLYETLSHLYMGLVVILVSLWFWAALIFYLERGEAVWDDESRVWIDPATGRLHRFQSIPHTFWWGITTLTTVGFGDVVPATWQGKVVASFAMISAVFVLALPTSIIGAKFLELYKRGQARDKKRITELKRERLKRLHGEDLSDSDSDAPDGEEVDAALVGGREHEIVELLMLIDDLAAAGLLTPSTVLQDADTGEVIVRPGDAETIRALVLDATKYPAVRAAYIAARRAHLPGVAITRFVQHAIELAMQSNFSSAHGTQPSSWHPSQSFVQQIDAP